MWQVHGAMTRPVTKLKAGLLIYRLSYVSTLAYSLELWVVTEWHSGYRRCASSKGCLGFPLEIAWGAQSFWRVSSRRRPQCRPRTHCERLFFQSGLGTWWPWWPNWSRSRRVSGLRLLSPKPGSGTEDRWMDWFLVFSAMRYYWVSS